MTETAPTASIYPNLFYRDADAAIEWLERTLGFKRGEVHRDENGAVLHAEVSLGTATVMLGTAGTGREPFRSQGAGGASVYCAVEDADRLYAHARDAGADIPLDLSETDYGSRDFTARDLEGHPLVLRHLPAGGPLPMISPDVPFGGVRSS